MSFHAVWGSRTIRCPGRKMPNSTKCTNGWRFVVKTYGSWAALPLTSIITWIRWSGRHSPHSAGLMRVFPSMFQALPESPRHNPISALRNSSSQDKSTASAVPLIRRAAAADTLELWGGVECSIVRIGNEFRNQLSETRHLTRDDDLPLIAKLGIRT